MKTAAQIMATSNRPACDLLLAIVAGEIDYADAYGNFNADRFEPMLLGVAAELEVKQSDKNN